MATLPTEAKVTLHIRIVDTDDVRSVMFEEAMLVCYACSFIREKFLLSDKASSASEYGLFKSDEEKAVWLNMGKTIKDYELCNGDTLQYKRKVIPYSVIMPDESILKIKLDHSRSTAENVKTVCREAGLSHFYEYSFEAPCLPNSTINFKKTIKKQDQKARRQSSAFAKNLWLKRNKSFAEQGLDENCVLTLKKKFCISDTPLPQGNSNALNLVYDQCKDAIINGSHPCTESEAIQLAALQCYVKFGKDKPASIKLSEFLPMDYVTGKDIEQSVHVAYSKQNDMTELECKTFYIQLCHSLPTYATTFFLVNEKRKGTKKLVPTLLGFKPSSVMRVDKVSKEIITSWPLHTVQRWVGTEEFFKIEFGPASQTIYAVQTTEGHAIADFLSELIDVMDNIRDKTMDYTKDSSSDSTKVATCGVENHLDNCAGISADVQLPKECSFQRSDESLSECSSSKAIDCPLIMSRNTEAGNHVEVSTRVELQKRNSTPLQPTSSPDEQKQTLTIPIQTETELLRRPVNSDLLFSSEYCMHPFPDDKLLLKTEMGSEPAADAKQEVQTLQAHLVRLQLELQMAMDQVKYAEQRAELAEKRAALAEERARKAEQSFRLSWQMTY